MILIHFLNGCVLDILKSLPVLCCGSYHVDGWLYRVFSLDPDFGPGSDVKYGLACRQLVE